MRYNDAPKQMKMLKKSKFLNRKPSDMLGEIKKGE
jgi:hypothetical protein